MLWYQDIAAAEGCTDVLPPAVANKISEAVWGSASQVLQLRHDLVLLGLLAHAKKECTHQLALPWGTGI